ncbi:MAG: hypothetical protein IJI21_01275 [Clostridia bacterium]|nr:hypothetical protein [Clostridia bacterium]
MSRNYNEQPNGYLETIQKGLAGVRGFRDGLSRGIGTRAEQIERLKQELKTADAIVIGAGAGLSTSAGFIYNGDRFMRYFPDFAARFGITDMYSGGFFPFPDEETYWAWWSRNIYCNRYVKAPKPVYENLLRAVADRDYFVITTNVDHMFQKAGFDKKRLFYTQGDYGLFQHKRPTVQKTWDNEAWVMQAMAAQGFVKKEDGVFVIPEDRQISMRIPTALIPRDPEHGKAVVPNLRVDDSFVEDQGWHRASAAYADFLRHHQEQHVLYLEIGVGSNTPVIIKYPFWQMTNDNPKAVYCCLNYNEANCPRQIETQSICIDGDTGTLLERLYDVITSE